MICVYAGAAGPGDLLQGRPLPGATTPFTNATITVQTGPVILKGGRPPSPIRGRVDLAPGNGIMGEKRPAGISSIPPCNDDLIEPAPGDMRHRGRAIHWEDLAPSSGKSARWTSRMDKPLRG